MWLNILHVMSKATLFATQHGRATGRTDSLHRSIMKLIWVKKGKLTEKLRKESVQLHTTLDTSNHQQTRTQKVNIYRPTSRHKSGYDFEVTLW